MGSIAEKWIEQGLQRGRQEGRQEGLQQGLQQGLLAGIELALEIRFGTQGLQLMSEIYSIQEIAKLQAIRNALRTAKRLDDIRKLVRAQENLG